MTDFKSGARIKTLLQKRLLTKAKRRVFQATLQNFDHAKIRKDAQHKGNKQISKWTC